MVLYNSVVFAVETRLPIPQRETAAREEVIRSFVKTDTRTNVPLDVVIQKHGEAAVEIILGPLGIGTSSRYNTNHSA